MRSVVYRFPDLEEFERIVCGQDEADLELGVPAGEMVSDGEWVLAIFELGPSRRATSAAARAIVSPNGARLLFELRDWRCLAQFVEQEASRPGSSRDVVPGPSGAAPAAPAGRGSSPGRVPTRPPAVPPHGRGARILVVDDDTETRDVIAAMLEAVELVVTGAGSAEEALERVRSARFDLVVLDWTLPKMNGLQLCRAIRREPGLSELPVLFLSANASSQDMVTAFASGADDYVVKPFRAPELGARIFALLRRTRRGAT